MQFLLLELLFQKELRAGKINISIEVQQGLQRFLDHNYLFYLTTKQNTM